MFFRNKGAPATAISNYSPHGLYKYTIYLQRQVEKGGRVGGVNLNRGLRTKLDQAVSTQQVVDVRSI